MKRVLIANRGEIALRIVRACHEEGLEAVAVYSEPDAKAPHVRAADFAVPIGPAPARESYLVIEKLINAAKTSKADAIHPGYGFLSERAHFADAVIAAGLTFIGPPPSAIRAMGTKTEARKRMHAAGVPVVPGIVDALKDAAAAEKVAKEIGFPVLLKATSGGGGKGMRRVDQAGDVANAFRLASSEALAAFGDGAVYIEKYLERPRHVEIQVFGDQHGHVMHFGERECSVQRRHQKLIEETPSPAVTPELRARMGQAAVQAAKAVEYVGAGTIEFLLAPNGEFYFLEMNTRIQVEHPITELVYGVDLVRSQLRAAAGWTLNVPAQVAPRGHAIECRITSEDPRNGFLPATGRIEYLRVPAGPGVRWDGGVEAGDDVGLSYDPLLAKLIVWGETRAEALKRMRRALDELMIVGLPTSQPFHQLVLSEPTFVSGKYDIGYMERTGDALVHAPFHDDLIETAAVAAAMAEHEFRQAARPVPESGGGSGDSAWLQAARRAGLR